MANRGKKPKKQTSTRAPDARERLLEAGESTLREHGFFGASARAVAERAGVAVGGVHYHFDSVEDLLLQAFDRSSAKRLEQYAALADASPDLGALVTSTAAFFEEDREQGRFRMLAEMMAASAGGGTLGGAVAERTEPWVELTSRAVSRFVGDEPFGVLNARDVAIGVVALFVGLELLDELDGDRFDTSGFLERASQLVTFVTNGFEGPGGHGT